MLQQRHKLEQCRMYANKNVAISAIFYLNFCHFTLYSLTLFCFLSLLEEAVILWTTQFNNNDTLTILNLGMVISFNWPICLWVTLGPIVEIAIYFWVWHFELNHICSISVFCIVRSILFRSENTSMATSHC